MRMNNPNESSYRRRYPRIAINFPVKFHLDRGEAGTRGLVLGGGGLFLASAEQLHGGDLVRVSFQPAKSLPMMEATTRLRYQIPGQGLGGEFTEISPEHRQIILRLIHNQMEDRRKYPRAAFAVEVGQKGGPAMGLTTDLSEGGLFVQTEHPAEPGATLSLRIHLGLGQSDIEAKAEVLYTVLSRGMGLRFLDMTPQDREQMAEFVAKRR